MLVFGIRRKSGWNWSSAYPQPSQVVEDEGSDLAGIVGGSNDIVSVHPFGHAQSGGQLFNCSTVVGLRDVSAVTS